MTSKESANGGTLKRVNPVESHNFFKEVMKSLTTIEIHMITNKNWKSKRKVE